MKKRLSTEQAKQAAKWITKSHGLTLAGIARKLGMPKNGWSGIYVRAAIVQVIGEEATAKAIRARKAEGMQGNRHGIGKKWNKKRRQTQSRKHTGPGNPNWKGGRATRQSKEYREFLDSILERDRYRCTQCGSRGGWRGLCVHHFSKDPELLMDPDNVTTRCRSCHMAGHNKERKNP